jgi:hypothetical protein
LLCFSCLPQSHITKPCHPCDSFLRLEFFLYYVMSWLQWPIVFPFWEVVDCKSFFVQGNTALSSVYFVCYVFIDMVRSLGWFCNPKSCFIVMMIFGWWCLICLLPICFYLYVVKFIFLENIRIHLFYCVSKVTEHDVNTFWSIPLLADTSCFWIRAGLDSAYFWAYQNSLCK